MSGSEDEEHPLERLRATAIQQEMEILRLKRAAQAAWVPPSADEFDGWFSPEDAVGGLSGRIEDGPKKRWLVERLRGGAITGVARQAQGSDGISRSFTPVPIRSWEHFDENDPQFWEFGDATIVTPVPLSSSAGGYGPSSARKERYFDVRFHPDDFSGGRRPRPIPAQPETTSPQLGARPLPDAEAQRVAKLILEIWGKGVTETRAVELARIVSPEHRVSRDPFLAVFRAIRGHKKPGKQPLNG